MRLGLRPADDRVLDLVREHLLELSARLFRGHDHDPRALQSPDPTVELFGELLQVLVDERFDVALVASLRPAALVVAARRLVELVDELFEPAGTHDVHGSALPPHDRNQRAVPTADKRHERREVELTADRDLVGNRIAERQRSPSVVEPSAEDRNSARAVSIEVALEEITNPGQV